MLSGRLLVGGLVLVLLSACAAPKFQDCRTRSQCAAVQQGSSGDPFQKTLLLAQKVLTPYLDSTFRQNLAPHEVRNELNRDAVLTARVRRIADKLKPGLFELYPYAGEFEWEVHVVSSPTLNAYAAPGGKIVFYSGLIRQLKMSDDEIAAVMGHEMVHAADLHGVKSLGSGTLLSLASEYATTKAGNEMAANLVKAGKSLLENGYSRHNEYTADHLGSKVAAIAGYNPRAAVTFHAKLENQAKREGGSSMQSEIFSTHPLGNNRMEELNQAMPQLDALYTESRKGKKKKGA